jgi:hypothetical protein
VNASAEQSAVSFVVVTDRCWHNQRLELQNLDERDTFDLVSLSSLVKLLVYTILELRDTKRWLSMTWHQN